MVEPVAGVLLTGGGSRRLGTDKARLVLDGATLAERAAGRLAAVCDPVVEVGPGITRCPRVSEEPVGSGPLAALAAGGDALRRMGRVGPVLLLAVDLPNVTVGLLELLRDWPGERSVVPDAAGRLQPVCARYSADALSAAVRLVSGGVRALHALLDACGYDVVPQAAWHAIAPADVFADVDTPDDAARLGIDLPRLR
ncbi:MAG TPA: NTP transferase domain-containing protein [Acidimicrobiia bacterium]|nr:NTP transferase domain-containing protein [Acidimicrobiia bacterium]